MNTEFVNTEFVNTEFMNTELTLNVATMQQAAAGGREARVDAKLRQLRALPPGVAGAPGSYDPHPARVGIDR
jgi:hypothetical protein